MESQKKLKKDIKSLRVKIAEIEQKRARSQAALVSALVNKTTPSDEDVRYFNEYTLRINDLREALRKKQKELDGVKA